MSQALLVVDMLNDFVLEDGALTVGPAGKQIIPPIRERIQEYRQKGDLILYVADCHAPDDKEFNMFPPHCIKGEEGAEIVSELRPQDAANERVIPKRRYSAFYGTDLDLTLKEKGIHQLELTGVCTNICILYTAADARMRYYDVTVRADTVASFDEAAHNFALKEMEHTLGVKII